MSLAQRVWSLTGSTLMPMIFVLRLSNSGLSFAIVPSSVVHTGVKSLGCENRTAQWSPIQSWNLILPCVVSAVKSGATSPMRTAISPSMRLCAYMSRGTNEYSAAAIRPPDSPATSGSPAQPRQLLAQLVERRAEARKPVALLLDDGAGRARNEAIVRELRFRLRDLGLKAGDFLHDSCPFRRHVDLDVEHQPEVADNLHRCIARGQRIDDAHVRQLRERGEIRREFRQRRAIPCRDE